MRSFYRLRLPGVALGREKSSGELAAQLYIGQGTAKTHLSSLLTKLGLRDRIQAVVYAFEAGLVQPQG